MKTKLNGPEVHQRLQDAEAMGSLIADHFENNFCDFARKACAVLEPNHKLTWSWHLDYLCEMLTLVKGRQLLRLIINVPPRTLKSTLITIVFPVWLWINEPQHRFMAASYSLALSAEHSLLRRNLLQSAWFRKLWGDRFQMSEDCNQIGNFMNDHGGQMIATSVGGTVMGRGCDTAILDDPLNADQALSNAERSKANNWDTQHIAHPAQRPGERDNHSGDATLARAGPNRLFIGARTRYLDACPRSTCG